MSVKITTNFTINAIVWITSLRPDEVGSTDRVLDSVIPFLHTISFPLKQFEPQSAAEFLAILDGIAHQVSSRGLRPLIHIDTHGNETEGIFVAGSNEFVSWKVLSERLRKINIALQNNLCVVSAACFGFSVVNHTDVTRPSPFFILIGPEKEVKLGFVETAAIRFYEEIFRTGDIVGCYERFLKSKLKMYHCEKMLALALAKYIRNKCMGKGGEVRRENLLTKILNQPGMVNNRSNRRFIRRDMKKRLRPSQALVDRYVRVFMLGRKVGFDLNDLVALVEKTE